MYAYPALPPQFHWSAEQLADAVPRRLHQLPVFQAGGDLPEACNGPHKHKHQRPARGYLPASDLPAAFRVR